MTSPNLPPNPTPASPAATAAGAVVPPVEAVSHIAVNTGDLLKTAVTCAADGAPCVRSHAAGALTAVRYHCDAKPGSLGTSWRLPRLRGSAGCTIRQTSCRRSCRHRAPG